MARKQLITKADAKKLRRFRDPIIDAFERWSLDLTFEEVKREREGRATEKSRKGKKDL